MQSSLLGAQIISRSHIRNASSCCIAGCAQLTLLKMGAEQQQQQSVDFKSCFVYFTCCLCDCAVQVTLQTCGLSLCVHSFSWIHSHALQHFWQAMLVQQVVLNSHQNLTNHGSVTVDVCHAVHWSLLILNTIRDLLQSPHRLCQVLQSKARSDHRSSSS